jgi:hypothetical protein
LHARGTGFDPPHLHILLFFGPRFFFLASYFYIYVRNSFCVTLKLRFFMARYIYSVAGCSRSRPKSPRRRPPASKYRRRLPNTRVHRNRKVCKGTYYRALAAVSYHCVRIAVTEVGPPYPELLCFSTFFSLSLSGRQSVTRKEEKGKRMKVKKKKLRQKISPNNGNVLCGVHKTILVHSYMHELNLSFSPNNLRQKPISIGQNWACFATLSDRVAHASRSPGPGGIFRPRVYRLDPTGTGTAAQHCIPETETRASLRSSCRSALQSHSLSRWLYLSSSRANKQRGYVTSDNDGHAIEEKKAASQLTNAIDDGTS